jgi:hypothetical protein
MQARPYHHPFPDVARFHSLECTPSPGMVVEESAKRTHLLIAVNLMLRVSSICAMFQHTLLCEGAVTRLRSLLLTRV